jgi:hypothetical protein
MLFDSVVFVVVVSFFLVEDLVDEGGVGLWLFLASFFFTRDLVIFLLQDVSFFCVLIGLVLTSPWEVV